MDSQDSFVHVRDGGYYKGMAQLPGVAGLSHYYSGASICRVKVFDVGSTPAIETRGVLLFFFSVALKCRSMKISTGTWRQWSIITQRKHCECIYMWTSECDITFM